MPKAVTCHQCGGKGYTYNPETKDYDIICLWCAGKGWIYLP